MYRLSSAQEPLKEIKNKQRFLKHDLRIASKQSVGRLPVITGVKKKILKKGCGDNCAKYSLKNSMTVSIRKRKTIMATKNFEQRDLLSSTACLEQANI